MEETIFKELWIEAEGGMRLYAHLHHPADGAGPWPCGVIVPGGLSPGTDYDDTPEFPLHELVSRGYAVLHYDPSGRGRTGGEEDFWGPRHQGELVSVLRHLRQMPEIGDLFVLSFSIGITIASGALARPGCPDVKFLFDWEGPSSRSVITMNDTVEFLRDHPCGDDAFWREREAVAFMGRVRCGYFRYQEREDHFQGDFRSHALELFRLARDGRAAWARLNGNPSEALEGALDEAALLWAERPPLEYVIDLLEGRGIKR